MNKYEIVKFVDEEVKLDVNISLLEKTIWISIEQMAVLFERDRSVISKHIKNIFLERELLEDSVCAFFAHTANDGKVYNVKYYNLDVVISVGYRVKSKIILIIENAKMRALKAVNTELITMYYEVGKYLSDLCAKSKFGDKVINDVEMYISKNNPAIKGFNRRGLYRMKQFYELYKDD